MRLHLRKPNKITCNHEFKATSKYDVEQCIGVICIKCGKLSCGCEALEDDNTNESKHKLLEKSTKDGYYYVGDEYYDKFYRKEVDLDGNV